MFLLTAAAALFPLSPPKTDPEPPKIYAILPPVLQRGARTSSTVLGENLQGIRLLSSGSGISVQTLTISPDGREAKVQWRTEPNAEFGPREVRAASPKRGISSAAGLWIDPLPAETAPDEGTAIEVPAGTSARPLRAAGRITTSRRRQFRILANAGETWTIDLLSSRILSGLSPILELQDARGTVIASEATGNRRDPRILHRFTKSGNYTIAVRDARAVPAPDGVFVLTAGTMPSVTSVLPLGEAAGSHVGFSLFGANLTKTSVGITLPREVPGGIYWAAPVIGGRSALPFPILVDDIPSASITETDADMPMPLAPVNLDGIFRRYPRTRFFFQAEAGERFVFDMFGRRIESSIDPALRIRDAAGSVIAQNLDASGKDSRLDFIVPSTGTYHLEAFTEDGRVGPDRFFRLQVRYSEPDFRLWTSTDVVNLHAGQRIPIRIECERLNGFRGAVQISATGMPEGVFLESAEIPEGASYVEAVLVCAENPPPGAGLVRLLGTGQVGRKPMHRVVVVRRDTAPGFLEPYLFSGSPDYRRPYPRDHAMGVAVLAPSAPLRTQAGKAARQRVHSTTAVRE
jgi:hypothetical protein